MQEATIIVVLKANNYIFFLIMHKMVSLSLNELKLAAKGRGIKDYKNKSEDELIKILTETKP